MPRTIDTLKSEIAHKVETFELPETFTAEKREKFYIELVYLNDWADEMWQSVMLTDDPPLREHWMRILRPLVTQVRCSADILAAFYDATVFKGLPITKEIQETNEAALRNIWVAYEDFLESVEATFLPPDEIQPHRVAIVETVKLELPEIETNKP